MSGLLEKLDASTDALLAKCAANLKLLCQVETMLKQKTFLTPLHKTRTMRRGGGQNLKGKT